MSLPWYRRLLGLGKNKKDETETGSNHVNRDELIVPDYYESFNKHRAPFRFPLLPDQEEIFTVRNGFTTHKTNKTHQTQIEMTISKDENTKTWDGWLTKAREVPSPVYGYQKKHLKVAKPQMDQTITIEDTSEHNSEITLNHQFKESLDKNKQEFVIETEMQLEQEIEQEIEQKTGQETDKETKPEHGLELEPIIKTEFEPDCELELESYSTSEQVTNEQVTESQSNERIELQSDQKTEKNIKPVPKSTSIPYNVLYFGKETEEKMARGEYQLPSLNLLKMAPAKTVEDKGILEEMVHNLEQALHSFNVKANVTGVLRGPTVTRIEVQPGPGVKVNRITNLTDDIKLNLAVKDIRIEAPIPGKSAIGIEVPNPTREPVNIRDVVSSELFINSKAPLTVALGKDIEGSPVILDLAKMPHGLIAGSTGSGKSVCINSIIVSLLYKATPNEVKLILVDPKMVELAPYHDLPHLATPVVTDPKQATMALKWAVDEMERRYELFAQNGVRDLSKYNELMASTHPTMIKPALPYIVIVIDELADLMMVAPGDVEESIARIAQKARACGIHLLVATQRPSVDVITGMIKANIPTRIAFAVSSQVDSRTILDHVGAERLLGQGDMLLLENGGKSFRLQGNYVSDHEIDAVCHFVRSQQKPKYLFDKESLVISLEESQEDELFLESLKFVIEQDQASTSALQRRFRIGYNRAARLIDVMEERGLVSGAAGSKPRSILITKSEFKEQFQ